MIIQLINNYNDFHDSLVTNINYYNGYNFSTNSFEENSLEISLSCYNINREYKRDLITIYCTGINNFIYEKWDGMIFETLMKEENGEIILDFASETDHDYFSVKCQKLTYTILEQE